MKLPHWAQLALGLANIILVWIIAHAAPGDLSLPAGVVTILIAVDKVISLFTDSVPTAMAAKRARLAAARASGLMLIAAAVTLLGCQGCGGTAGQIGTVVIPPIVDVGACVIKVIGVDLSKGETLDQAFADAEAQCLLGHPPSAAERSANDPTVQKIWGSVVEADEARGLRLPDGGTP
jgi:hypothetical protein